MQYDNTNSGILFRNEKKQTEKHPDFTGSINSEGREFFLSAWVNETKDGRKYFKLALSPKDEKPAPKQDRFDDQSIPF